MVAFAIQPTKERRRLLHHGALLTSLALKYQCYFVGTHLADLTLTPTFVRIFTVHEEHYAWRHERSTMRHEKNLPATLIPQPNPHLGATTAPSKITHAGLNALTRSSVALDTIDVCAEMFRFCKQLDERYLHPRKIQCLFDVDSGAMHREALKIVCEVIETLLTDIAQSGVCHARGASLTVTLRRQHGVWILALTERRIAALRQTATVRRLSLVRRRAQLLGAACRVHETSEGFITALMFDCDAVSSGWRNVETSSTIH